MRSIDVQAIIDPARDSVFHWKLLGWCSLLLIFDGYDLFVYGAVLPVLMQQWHMSALEAGALVGYALFGMMLGAVLFGTLADQVGRKKSIAVCCLLFSMATLVTGFTTNPVEFGVCRFIAGLGCGGLMPNVVALMNEYAPRKSRSLLVAIMFCGYPLGGMLSAGVGMYLLPHFGWEAMFYFAAVPLLMLPLILWHLSESIGVLWREGYSTQARALLLRLDPACGVGPEDVLRLEGSSSCKASLPALFQQGRAVRTVLLWVAFFCCLLMIYALSSWLPKLMANAGYSLGSSLSFLVALNVGAVLGAVVGGWLGDRFALPKVLVIFLLLAAGSIALLGLNSPAPILYLLITLAGAATIGTQILLYACAAQFYEMSIRSTGMGWASGISRNGAIAGPLLGGLLLGANLPLTTNFLAFALPGVIGAAAMLLFVCYSPQPSTAVPDGAGV